MIRVLVFIGHYLPGWRVGGPARSISSMAERLADTQFFVFTSETDFRSHDVLDGIHIDEWQLRGAAKVHYASARNRTPAALRRAIIHVAPDIIYLNGVFARRFTIPVLALRRVGLLPRISVIVAPRGEFSPGALRLKSLRKQSYLRFAASLGLYRDVVWHAASEQEVEDIRRVQESEARIVLAPNFPPIPAANALGAHRPKKPACCRLVFLSRISTKKNLSGAISSLLHVQMPVSFDIYGPVEDAAYWARCRALIDRLPGNVTVRYRGEVRQGQAQTVFAAYDAMFLPTLGENYGHVIAEAWAAATPVLISDRTPWLHLEAARAGWTAHPDDHCGFARIVDQLALMSDEEHARWRAGAADRAVGLHADDLVRATYARLFDQALAVDSESRQDG